MGRSRVGCFIKKKSEISKGCDDTKKSVVDKSKDTRQHNGTEKEGVRLSAKFVANSKNGRGNKTAKSKILRKPRECLIIEEFLVMHFY